MFRFALTNLKRNPTFYLPFLLILLFFAFLFCSLLALAFGSSQIYKKSGSEELLAVFESNRACVMASLVPEEYKARIAGLPHIEDITGEVRHIIVYAPKKSLTIAGVEPDKFRDFKDIEISSAEYEDFKKDPHGVIIGKKVQQMFNWQVGKSVTLQRMKFNVRGAFKLPLSVYNGMIIFHKEYMQKLVKKEGYFTAITLKIDSPENKSAVSEAVEQLLADHPAGISCKPETEFWGMTEKQMGDFGKNMRVLTQVCALFLFVLIVNGVAFRNRTRKKEFRILRMVGYTRSRIYTLFIIEPVLGILLSAIGGGLLAFFVWIKQPTIGGEHAIVPPIVVTPLIVAASTLLILFLALLSSALVTYRTANGMRVK